MFMEKVTSDADLWALSQGPKDLLHDYLKRFKETLAKMSSVNDHTTLAALICELWHEYRFREDITITPPATIQDALYRGSNWARDEIEREILD